MKNYSIIAAVVALALTLAFIVQFTGAQDSAPVTAQGSNAKNEPAVPYQGNTVSHQTLKIAGEDDASKQVLQIQSK